MGRRTSKKSKKITLDEVYPPNDVRTVMKKVEGFNSSQKWYRKMGRKILKSGIYKKKDKFSKISYDTDSIWHSESAYNPVITSDSLEEITRSMREFCSFNCNCLNFPVTGKCAVCGFSLVYKFPDDYPDDWKFCCFCQPLVEKLIDDTLKPTTPELKKLYGIITLVKRN